MLPLTLWALERMRMSIDTRLAREQTLRAVLVFSATLPYIVSIAHVPLANAIGVYLIGPIVAAVLAMWLLGESRSRR